MSVRPSEHSRKTSFGATSWSLSSRSISSSMPSARVTMLRSRLSSSASICSVPCEICSSTQQWSRVSCSRRPRAAGRRVSRRGVRRRCRPAASTAKTSVAPMPSCSGTRRAEFRMLALARRAAKCMSSASAPAASAESMSRCGSADSSSARISSIASRLATSPAAYPPMPSARTAKPLPASAWTASSLLERTMPLSLAQTIMQRSLISHAPAITSATATGARLRRTPAASRDRPTRPRSGTVRHPSSSSALQGVPSVGADRLPREAPGRRIDLQVSTCTGVCRFYRFFFSFLLCSE